MSATRSFRMAGHRSHVRGPPDAAYRRAAVSTCGPLQRVWRHPCDGAEASGPPSRWLDCWRRPAGALSAQAPPPHERQPAALSGAFCGLSIESTTIVRRVIGFERFRARGRGPALIARQPSRRTVANRHERSGRSTMSFDARQRDAAPDDAAWLAELNARATLTQQRLAELKAMLDEMRMERDAWRDQALRLALPAPAPSITLWRWLRSTG
jgi:hypothetical protein